MGLVVTACSGGEDDAPTGSVEAAATTAPDAPTASDDPDTAADSASDEPSDDESSDESATTAGTAPATTVAATPEEQLDALLSRAPVSADIEVESDGSATATIGPDGGSIDVVGADGTTYTLDIPAEALVTPVDIVLTPLSGVVPAIDGAELIGVAAEPDGIAFLRPAPLTITGDAVTDDWVGWGALGDGTELALSPTVRGGASRTMPVAHFSIMGLASDELQLMVSEHGVGFLAGATFTAAEALLARPDDTTLDLFLAALGAWTASLESKFADVDGLPDLEVATVELTSLLAVLEAVQGVSFDPEVVTEVVNRVQTLFEQWTDAVLRLVPLISTQCSDGIDVAFQLARWRVVATGLANSTLAVAGTSPAEVYEALDDAVGTCASVVVTWQPTVTVSDPAGSVTTKATARSGPIALDDVTWYSDDSPGVVLSGRASGQPFVVDDVTTSFDFCDIATTPGQATMGAQILASVAPYGSIADAELEKAIVIAADDAPIQMSCGGQEFGFEFFSSEYEILNIEQGRVDPQGDGYGRFAAEPTGELSGVLARGSFTDTGTRGSTATVVQEVSIELAGG